MQTDWWVSIWKTKSAGKQAIRALVARTPVGSRIEGADLTLILRVLSHHPHWAIKRGVGVAGVGVVRYAHAYGSNVGLEVQRSDGSAIDISWMTCFDGIRQDRDVKAAARFEIAPQRQHAINTGVCGLCGQPLHGPLQIDHAPPNTFKVILSDFMSERALRWNDIAVVSLDGLHSSMADRALAGDWSTYHAARAVLRVVHKGCNLAQHGRRAV